MRVSVDNNAIKYLSPCLTQTVFYKQSGSSLKSSKQNFKGREQSFRKKLLKDLESYQQINDSAVTPPPLETLQTIRAVIEALSFSEILKPTLMIDPEGEIALYWKTEDYYGELGADIKGKIYFFINNRKKQKNLSSASFEGDFKDGEKKILAKIKEKFSSGGSVRNSR